MTRLPLLGFCTAVVLTFASVAVADDAACLDAASKGQRFRATHKLVEAREQLRICAAAACPTVVQSDCAGWLASVEKALPSLVVTAKDDVGTSLIDVKVSMDGQPFLTRLEGKAVSINPGPHTLRFEGPDGATLEQVVMAAEGEQNQRVAVVFAKKAGPSEANPAKGSPKASPQAPVSGGPARNASPAGGGSASGATATPPGHVGGPHGGASWRTVGWVAVGAGALGLAVGAVFGFMAMEDHNQAQCNANNVCFSGPLSDSRNAATDANVALVAGGVLAAAGIGLVLFAPTEAGGGGGARPGVTAVISPVLAPNAGALGVRGSW